MDQYVDLNVSRLNEGRPIIQADPDGWDSRFTLNPTALYLERSPRNDRLIGRLLSGFSLDDPRLRDGVVAIYYRGIPEDVPGLPRCRSSVGLAVFTPDLQLLHRFPYPVIVPTDDPEGYDYNGVEDQRITQIGDTFYLIYCGFVAFRRGGAKVQVCMAESEDLINWKKLGPVAGNVNNHPNKDAVLFPEPIDGRYVMMHRPCVGRQSDFSVSLAVSDSPTGVWKDCGTVMSAVAHPRYTESWVGMGSTPISLGGGLYLADYHTGNFLPSGERDYFANIALLDFNNFDPRRPRSLVRCRYEGLIFPETRYERNSPWPHAKPLNCVFPCGSYEYQGGIHIIYGGADAYVLAAKVSKEDVLRCAGEICDRHDHHAWGCSCLREPTAGLQLPLAF